MSGSSSFIGLIVVALLCLVVTLSVSGCHSAFKQKEAKIVQEPTTSTERLWAIAKKSSALTWLAIPIIALGAVAMFNGAVKLGMSAIIFGSVNLFMALATARFALIMATCGLIGSVAAVAASILAKNKALKEVVFGVQKIKDNADENNVDLVFQDKMREVLQKQTKSTKKFVKKIKSKLNKKEEGKA